MTGQAATEQDATSDPVYNYKPSLLGAPWEFYLRSDGLEWRAGLYHGYTPYERITRMRLSYRPVTMQSRRFLTEVWSAGGPRLLIASSSCRSMVEQANQNEAYSAFIREFHRRLAATRTKTLFQTGSPAILYWPGLAVFILVALALAVLTVRGLWAEPWYGGALIGAFLALFVWQSGTYFHRNRPGSYRPDAVPAAVLPTR